MWGNEGKRPNQKTERVAGMMKEKERRCSSEVKSKSVIAKQTDN